MFFLLAITFILLGAGNSGDHTNVIKWGGYVGLATAAAAWYASFAAVRQFDLRASHRPGLPLQVATGEEVDPARTLETRVMAGGGAGPRRRQSGLRSQGSSFEAQNRLRRRDGD